MEQICKTICLIPGKSTPGRKFMKSGQSGCYIENPEDDAFYRKGVSTMRKFLDRLLKTSLAMSATVSVLLMLIGCLLLVFPVCIVHIIGGIIGAFFILLGIGNILSLVSAFADIRLSIRTQRTKR